MRRRREVLPLTPEGVTEAARAAQNGPPAPQVPEAGVAPENASAGLPGAANGHVTGRRRRRAEVADPAVQETTGELRDEIDKKAREEARASGFEKPNNKPYEGKESPLHPEIERIVETIIIEHPWDVYQRLENALRVGDQRTDHGSVTKALDEAETNVRLAHRLWVTAEVEHRRWYLENQRVFGAMRLEATAVLQREKASGLRNKMITDADVDAMCSSLFPEQWHAQEVKQKKVELMVKSMFNLNEAWLSRCRSLQTMLSKQR